MAENCFQRSKLQKKSNALGYKLSHHPDIPLVGRGERLMGFECRVAEKRDWAVLALWLQRDKEQIQPQLPIWLR